MSTTIGRHRISKQYSHVVLNPVPYNKSKSYLRKKWCVYRTKNMGDLNIGCPEPRKAIYDNHSDMSDDTRYSGLREDEAIGMECTE